MSGRRGIRGALLALLCALAPACGTILGIGDPTVESEAGAPKAKDASGGGKGGGDSTVEDAPGDSVGSAEGSDDATPEAIDAGDASDAQGDGGGEAGCQSPLMICGSTCTNLQTDPANCGGCGNACLPQQTCSSGACACAVGESVCGVPVVGDSGVDAEGGAVVGTDSGTLADAGGGYCANLHSDIQNCGGCGAACPVNHSTPICFGGVCGNLTCDPGFADCNGLVSDGCETDKANDPANCGSCGHACPSGETCGAGGCVCPSGETECHAGADGGGAAYCANLVSDTQNCGACGTACPVEHNTPSCTLQDAGLLGSCGVGTCVPGFLDCNGVASDGCEVDKNTDTANCGSCGHQCPSGQLCSAGVCSLSCPGGETICGTSSTGYCANLQSDSQNCHTCGDSCTTSCTGHVASVACQTAACHVTGCAAGYMDLDGVCSDGCECAVSTTATCPSPQVVGLGGVGTQAVLTGNLVPAGTDTWLQVTFTGNTSTSYHPHVVLTANPGSEYAFDIEPSCGAAALTCGEGGQATGLDEWEVAYASGVDPTDPTFTPVPSVGTVLVHVYRASGKPVDCLQYTLTISN